MNVADIESAAAPIESTARDLSNRHVTLNRPPKAVPVWSELTSMRQWLGEALAAAKVSDPNGAVAAEWLLDNDYHVQRTILQIGEDLPARFYRRLPSLGGAGEEGLPRVFALGHGLLHASHLQLSLTNCVEFVRAYQEQAPLTIAELWAFPTMLRLACFEVLTTAFARLFPDVKVPFVASVCAEASASIDDTECVSRALANLAVISSILWKDFFDRTSRVEEILTRDPGGVYPQMDFDTRDSYRHVVEELALHNSKTEWLVAEELLAQCQAKTADQSQTHVGYWLVGEGRVTFEKLIVSRPLRLITLGRMLSRHVGLLYGAALCLAGAAGLVVPALYLRAAEATTSSWLIGFALSVLPASVLSVTLVNWIVTLIVPPRTLPKLDFKDAIPLDFRTAVVVPVLVARPSEVAGLIQRLESHRLSNPDPTLHFVLLSDHADGLAAAMPGDDAVVGALVKGIGTLNARYGDNSGNGPFQLLHRPRLFNPTEGCWMAWERKRGKLEQFNRFVLHGDLSGFSLVAGNIEALRNIRFVVTADADTRLPPGSVNRLVGTLAHPLNSAIFDNESGRVRSGYTIVQPRIEIAPDSTNRSLFTRLYAGDAAIDIYSRAVSDVYQDLFGTGIFAGKGIYDVAAFEKSLEGRIPVNNLVSHDLFEGLHGRAALASDIIIYEGFPSGYLDYARRWHRWIRGDWQLLPWLGRRVPGRDGRRLPNRLSFLDRWKILDNLRRSLVPISLVALALAGWFLLHGNPWVWTILTVVVPGAYLFTDLVTGLARGRRRGVVRSTLRRSADHIGRWALAVIFLINDAALATSAIGRSLWRLRSGRHLLEWTSAAHMAAQFAAEDQRTAAWRDMWLSPAFAVFVAAGLWLSNSAALASAMPLVILWFLAPEVAVRVSRARPLPVEETTQEDRAFLRRIARRTWLFFETFVRPEDNWLPPDNYQEPPQEEVAHRTSPTNIGMMFLSYLTAWKLGYIGLIDLATRMRNALDSLDRLEHHRGHLLNWYDTRHLKPLEPRYVSTVDSGNLAVSLIVMKEACHEAMQGQALRPQWDGLCDGLHLLSDALAASSIDFDDECHAILRNMEEDTLKGQQDAERWTLLLEQLCERHYPQLDASIRRSIEKSKTAPTERLREIHTWLERTHHHLTSMRRDIQTLLPWRLLILRAPAGCEHWAQRIAECLPADLTLPEMESGCREARTVLAELAASEAGLGAKEWAGEIDRALVQSVEAHRDLHDRLQEIATRSAAWAHGMNFRILFDKSTRLFYIGYNVSAGRIDPHHYDLLATEARLASFFAISKGDVAPEHWFFLGRPITKKASGLSLVSWNGSMFEYLMPTLLLRSDPSTLLGQSDRTAVDLQREYGHAYGVPWGISESGFASQDPEKRYRYRAFGIPDLGLRRGLSRDLVVAPYATVLALSVRAGAALQNLKELARLGLVGRYGFYEAVDFTPERVPAGDQFSVVRSYMAHHHGMSLAALGNELCSDVLVEWFHSDPHIRTIDLLLNERVPWEIPPELTRDEVFEGRPLREGAIPGLRPWNPRLFGEHTQLHNLSNGRLTSRVTTMGGGGLWWHQHVLTRWRGGAGSNTDDPWLYIQDKDDDRLWSIGREPLSVDEDARVVFHQHQAEFHRRDHGIAVSMTVGIPPGDDLEFRRITVVNETGRVRRLALTSYAELVLAPPRDYERHPAFSKLFVGSEYLPKMNGLLFMRRPCGPDERPPVMLHHLVADEAGLDYVGFETDRRAFLGRYGQADRPAALLQGGLSGGLGWILDPVMALQAGLDLEPYERRELAFITIAAGSRESALEIAERYTTLSSLDWASSDAATEAAREVHRLGLEPDRLPEVQALLSAVLRPQPALRTAPALIAANRLGQPDLWALGISGDHPILALRIGDAQKTDLLRILVAAYQLWRAHGVTVDLVVLHTGISGYVEPVRERLIEALRDAGAQDFLGRNGGIHLVLADQADAGRALLVEAAAHVVLDETAGSLRQQLTRLRTLAMEGPRFEPTGSVDRIEEAVQATPRADDLLFDNGFGGFSPEGTEYVVHVRPDDPPPAPWSNVLANAGFGSIVTEAGLGWTWAVNSGENRLTPWSNDPVADPQAEALYLRDEESARQWTPTPQPAGNGSACRVRHGAGYTIWERSSEGLEQELLTFVANDDPVKVVRLRVRNLLSRPRRITAAYYAEWLLGAVARQPNPLLVAEYDAGSHALLASNRWNPEFGDRVAFLTSTLPPHSLTTSRSEFFGRHGDAHRPGALLRWDLGGQQESATDCCAAFQVHLDIGADGSGEVVFILGQGEDKAHACQLARRWQRREQAEQRPPDGQRQAWNERLGALQVKTPDAAFDIMVNRWLLYQTMSSRLLARAGFYQAGGAFGFRDQLQDVLAFLHIDPDRARRHILTAAARQFEEGDVLHWWHPPLDRGVRTRCSDDLLWLPYAASAYVEATGDDTILSETAPFLRAPPLAADEKDRYARFEATPAGRSIFEHCERALDRGFNLGSHGLPLIGSGDWNDGMDRVGEHGRGESVWLAWFMIATIKGFVGLCEHQNRDDLVERWSTRASDLQRAVEESGWDGEWYLRAIDDDGRPWGSASNDECRIDSIAQSWAVLSGAGNPERVRQAMGAAARHLIRDDDRLVRLLWPAFDTTPREPGYIKAYPPGIRENGGQYSHAAAWLGIAFAHLGDGDRAKEVFDRLNPIMHARDRNAAERYRTEPYVVVADIAGNAPHIGRGGWSWYTGAAAWTWRLAVEHILGLRLEKGELLISPCLPKAWKHFEAHITRPAGALMIRVEDPDGLGTGNVKITVDGKLQAGRTVRFPTDGTTHQVLSVIQSAARDARHPNGQVQENDA